MALDWLLDWLLWNLAVYFWQWCGRRVGSTHQLLSPGYFRHDCSFLFLFPIFVFILLMCSCLSLPVCCFMLVSVVLTGSVVSVVLILNCSVDARFSDRYAATHCGRPRLVHSTVCPGSLLQSVWLLWHWCCLLWYVIGWDWHCVITCSLCLIILWFWWISIFSSLSFFVFVESNMLFSFLLLLFASYSSIHL
jgi:hypothetical protein